jgi:micrococcal nuclease
VISPQLRAHDIDGRSYARPVRASRLVPWIVLLAAVAAYLAAGGRSGSGDAESAPVTRVVDGDTIEVRLDERLEKVRLIGIDTPESVKPGTPVQCYAKAASAETERLLDGRRVTLRFDAERRDRYGRLLAYVYRDGLFVNAELVERGYARTLTIPPNVAHADLFARLARDARERGRGLWVACKGGSGDKVGV